MRGIKSLKKGGEDRYTLYDMFMEAYLIENESELIRDLADLAVMNAESKYEHFVPGLADDVLRMELGLPRRRMRLRDLIDE